MTPLWIARGAGLGVRFGGATGSESGVGAAALHGSALARAGPRGRERRRLRRRLRSTAAAAAALL